MTFYVRVSAPQAPDPQFITEPDGTAGNYVFYYDDSGNKVKATQGETLEVPSGKHVYVHFRIQNQGGQGDCQVWAKDTKTGNWLASSDTTTLDTNGISEGNFDLGVPPEDGWDVELHACYIEDSTVYTAHTLGCGCEDNSEDNNEVKDLVFGVEVR